MIAPRTRAVRWLVPFAVLAVLLAGAGLRATLASATPSLPDLTAAQVLAKVAQSDQQSLSGVVRTSADLGLPALPQTQGELAPQALLSGEHTLRVYLDGPERQRVDLLADLAETKLVHNGRDVWQWSSSTNKATHTRLPAMPTRRPGNAPDKAKPDKAKPDKAKPDKAKPDKGEMPTGTPQALAQMLIDAITPSTQVTVGKAATVAGRSTYDLRLAPKTADSLIQRADLYVDSATGLPLRVTVMSRGSSKPAIDIGFTSIKLKAPSASVFKFSAPAGAKVTERRLPGHGWSPRSRPNKIEPHDGVPGPKGSDKARPRGSLLHLGGVKPRVLGEGWATAVEIRAGSALAAAGGQLNILLKGSRQVTGRFGSGKLLTTRLLTVLITDDGRIFVGPVTAPAMLRIANSAGPR